MFLRKLTFNLTNERPAHLFKGREFFKDAFRYIGNPWFGVGEDHRRIYKLWASFRDKAILGIGGMTMNERLYWFGLHDEFDACQNQESKLKIYNTIMANPYGNNGIR